jgi:murein DD-endopeptidase MepM/ murein hydrolase activator NlpD
VPTITTRASAHVPAHAAAIHATLPGLNRRSVRNLRHLSLVRSVRRYVAVIAALFVAALVAGFGVPAYAHSLETPPAPVIQTFSVPASVSAPAVASLSAKVADSVIARDGYAVTSPPSLQWPVDSTSPISSGFGPRVSPCSGCSSYHEGADFDPGYGAPVHAIAAGVVVETNDPGWAALGIHVAIQHVIGGQVVTSAYGHMQVGSMRLKVGDVVYPGEVVGLVGSTGASTGAHLHFEIRVGGTTPVDPIAWMHAHLG